MKFIGKAIQVFFKNAPAQTFCGSGYSVFIRAGLVTITANSTIVEKFPVGIVSKVVELPQAEMELT